MSIKGKKLQQSHALKVTDMNTEHKLGVEDCIMA